MWKSLIILFVMASIHLHAQVHVLALAGSTREDSLNKKLVQEAANFAKQAGAKVTYIDLRDYSLPFYDGDLESSMGMPEKAKQLLQLFKQNQIILIASPEYNGSIPAVLKNVLDWISRTEEGGPARNVLKGKKVILMSASPSQAGGARSLVHLRQILENIGATVGTKQFSLPEAHEAMDAQGHLQDPKQRKELQQLIQTEIR